MSRRKEEESIKEGFSRRGQEKEEKEDEKEDENDLTARARFVMGEGMYRGAVTWKLLYVGRSRCVSQKRIQELSLGRTSSLRNEYCNQKSFRTEYLCRSIVTKKSSRLHRC